MILLLSGSVGVGKDTFADYLVNNHKFIKFSFADSLKEQCSIDYNIDINNFYDRKLKETLIDDSKISKLFNITFRNILIQHGKKERSIDIDCFVKNVINKIYIDEILSLQNKEINYVISDCGFLNEQTLFKKMFNNVITIWIDRKIDRIEDGRLLTKDNCELILDNNTKEFDGDFMYLQLKQYIMNNK